MLNQLLPNTLCSIQGRISLIALSLKHNLLTIFLLFTLFFVVGCGSVRPSFLPSKQDIRPHSLTAFELNQAFVVNDKLYIQYLEAGRLRYQVSSFDRIVHVDSKPVNQNFSTISRREWKNRSSAGVKIKLLSEEHWDNFTLDLENRYFNQQRFFKHVSVSEQVSDYEQEGLNGYTNIRSSDQNILNSLKNGDWSNHDDSFVFSELRRYLFNKNIHTDNVLFKASVDNDLAAGLVYCDLLNKKFQFFSLAPHPDVIKPNVMKRNFLTDTGVTAGQLVKSMAMDMVIRPISSLQRLTFLIADTSIDNIQRTALTTVRFPSLSGQPIPHISETGADDLSQGMDLDEWEKRLDKITGKQPTFGSIKYLIDGEEFFPRFIETVNDAEKLIYLHFYIFDSDDYALKIADLLREKSKEVKVKVLYDGSGSLVASWGNSASQPSDYRAPVTIGKYLSHNSNVNYRVQGTPWLASDHTKTVIIDSDLAFVGGMNIGREYRYEWHDLMMEVRGPVVNKIKREFDKTWAHQGWFGDLGYLAALFKPMKSVDSKEKKLTKTESKVDEQYPIRVLKTTPSNSEIYNTQLAAIRNAKQRIFIQNSYLTDDVVIYELAKARRRGVDVRVIMSLDTDAGAISRSNLLSANTLLDNGIRVYAYPKMSHVKAAIYDGWACLGSANFDHLSLRVNKELNLATSNPKAVQALNEKLFVRDFEASVELTEKLESRWTDQFVEIIADHM
ncbi:MAG: phospholipase D-like domain-containing protein [Cellvibrionaceae bacterium]